MPTDSKISEFARGEAISRIHWGAEVDEFLELLRSKHGIVGAEADALIEEAIALRKSEVRKKAGIRLAFALVGLAISLTYFGIQFFAGFIRVGGGLFLMAGLGLASLTLAARNVNAAFTGDSIGPV